MFLSTEEYNKTIFTKNLIILFNILLKNGNEARLVGGCVRNFLLKKKINDYDIATIYKPYEVENILKNNNIQYYSIGKKFGTITAIINEEKFEITTLRKDIKTDGRHTEVEFTDNYKDDAERRDFTFNALYMDFNGKIYDYFNGIYDLKNNIIRFIGDGSLRIKEDNLRIMRFFRFYSSYCTIANYNDLMSCVYLQDKINNLSKERISDEFHKILSSAYPVKVLILMQYYSILQTILNINFLLDLQNLYVFFSIRNYIHFDYNHLFIICLILSKNNFDYNLFLTNNDKKYIKLILNNIPKKIDDFEIKKILFTIKNKEIVYSVIVLYHCNNFTNFKILEKDLDFLQTIEIPQLNITGQKLIQYGFTQRELFSKIINEANNIFIQNNFSITEEKIIEQLKLKYD